MYKLYTLFCAQINCANLLTAVPSVTMRTSREPASFRHVMARSASLTYPASSTTAWTLTIILAKRRRFELLSPPKGYTVKQSGTTLSYR